MDFVENSLGYQSPLYLVVSNGDGLKLCNVCFLNISVGTLDVRS